MKKKLSISLAIVLISIVALGLVGAVSADQTLREFHASKGMTLPDSPTKDECAACHSSILEDGTEAGVNKFHITHVNMMGISCTQCHKVDESPPTLKPLVEADPCISCHSEGGPGRKIYEGEAPPTEEPTTSAVPSEEPTTTPDDDTPGFEIVFAMAGLLAVAYIVTRRRK